jgi:flavoprotein hydroxylase
LNLAWKLDLVMTGGATPALLETYEEERRPGAVAALELSIELGKVICVPDPAAAAERDEAMAAAVTGEVSAVPGQPPLVAGLVQLDSPLAGEQFPQVDVGSRRFDDVHGAGWRLVTNDPTAPDLDADLVEWFAGIGGVVVAVGDAVPDLSDWFRTHDARWALQRPDFHLYGSALDVTRAAALLSSLREELAGSR